ncbi:hypothetical protein BH10BAC5_BH10BAC5_24270 [soil metagenome]
MNLTDVIKKFRKGIILTVSLVLIENIAWIIEPYLLGVVIDKLIDKEFIDPTTSTLSPLIAWIGLFLVNSGVGSLRRVLDTKIFLGMFTKIATFVAENSLEKKLSVSKTSARAELSFQYITFLQFRMPEIIDHTISIFGAIIAMYLFDWKISLICFAIIIPLYIINKFYIKKVSVLQKEFHDQYEDVVDVISKQDPAEVSEYYTRLSKPQIKISNLGALNFGVMRFFLLLIFLTVLYISIDLDGFSAGELFSIVAYLWTFVTASENIPELLESYSSLQDISARLKKD